MTEVMRMADLLKRSFEGEAWHGPAVREALEGVDAATAARRPIASAHSIWEIVLHMAAWKGIVTRRFAGEPFQEVPPEVDWPAVPGTGVQEWGEALMNLERAHAALTAALVALADADLDRPAPGGKTLRYLVLHGIIHHDLYHAGQIVILKKA